MAEPRTLLVCCTPRSGSNLLGDALRATGLVSIPLEYFNHVQRPGFERDWGCDGSIDSYLRALQRAREERNGELTIKLHWDHLVALRAELLDVPAAEPEFGFDADFLAEGLPGARYVRVLRQDLTRQAVSFWIALVTDVWVDRISQGQDTSAAPARPAFYSFEGIARCRTLLENHEVCWDRFFRANAIEPHVVVYERLVADRDATVRGVLRFLRPELDVDAVDVPPPGLRRQADELAEEYVERFARERAERPPPHPGALAHAAEAGQDGR